MYKYGILTVLALGSLCAEVHVKTLQEAVELSLKQNPDIAVARLSERKAAEGVRLAKDPFWPRLTVGSGLAYSSGYPMSIEGSGPSLFQAQATQFIFNREQHYRVKQAKEEAKLAAIDTLGKGDEIVFRAASLYLDAERNLRMVSVTRRQVENLTRIKELLDARVSEGRELPIELKRASLNLARARQRAQRVEADQAYAESLLAALLGLDPNDRVRAGEEDRTTLAVPPSEEAAAERALANSKELRRLEASLVAKGYEIQAGRATRLPRLDLVAQYAMFARFNNYDDFYRRFDRHNGQIGISVQIPLLTGPGVDARTSQSEAELAELRLQAQATQSRIVLDTRRSYQEMLQAMTASEVARLDLDVAREELSVLLAQMEEGHAGLRQVEEARFLENEKWLVFYEARDVVQKARLNLLRQTGEIVAALR